MTFDEWLRIKPVLVDTGFEKGAAEIAWNAALSEVEKIIKKRIEKHLEDGRYLIKRGHAREQYMKYKRYRSECESILSTINKLREKG